MPKITGMGTPSIGVPIPPQEFDQGQFFNKGEKEEVPPSAGSSSESSSDSKPTTPGKPRLTDATRKPARSAGNLSAPARTGDSSASRTGGARPDPGKH